MPASAPALSFSHFGMFATDPDALADFYVRVLGFTITDTGALPSGALVFLSRDPTEHHQIVLCAGRPEGSYNSVNQVSLRAGALDDLRTIQRLAAAEPRVKAVLPVSHGNAISLYFLDPEGNRMTCFVDAPFFCAQPQRVAVDLSQSDAEIWAAIKTHTHTQPKFMTRAQWEAARRQKMGISAAQARL